MIEPTDSPATQHPVVMRPEAQQDFPPMIEFSISDLPSTFQDLIESLNLASTTYVVLRPSGKDQSGYQELDILVDPCDHKEFFKLCETCGFYKSRPNPFLMLKQVFYKYKDGTLLVLDVHFAMVSKGLEYLDYSRLLKRRVFRDGAYYLDHTDQLLHLAFHCILDKRQVPKKYVEFFEAYSEGNYEEAYAEDHLRSLGTISHFKLFFGSWRTYIETLDNSSQCHQLQDQVKRTLRFRTIGNFARRLWIGMGYYFKRLVGKRGVLIAVVGPDGVGKSTLTNRIQERISEFRQTSTSVYMGPWGHSILPVAKLVRLFGAPSSDSRWINFPIISQFRWLIYLVLLSVEFVVRHAFRVLPARRNYSVVFSDRYFYDVGAGYKKRAVRDCQWLRQLFCKLLLRPELTIFLFASSHVVASRKDELNDVQAAAFNQAYHEIAGRLAMMIVESDRSIEEVIESVIDDIWPIILCSRTTGRARRKLLVADSKSKYSG